MSTSGTPDRRDASPASSGADLPRLERELDVLRRAVAASQRREQELRRHNAVLVDLSRCQAIADGDVDAAFREVTRVAAETLGIARCGIWLYDDARSCIRCRDLYERGTDRHSSGLELKAVDFPAYFAALEEGRTLAASEAQSDPRTREFTDAYLRPLGITSMLDATVRLSGGAGGIVCHEHIGAPREWSLEDQAFAGSMADFVAMALQAADRNRAETAERESEERYRRLVESVQAIVWRAEPGSLRFSFVSREAETILGYPVERWTREADFWVRHMHPEDRDWVTSYWLNDMAGGPRHAFEYRMIAADGRVVWLRDIVNVITRDGRPTEAVGVMIDVSDRRLVQEELEQQRRFLRTIIDMNPNLIFAKDRSGRFTLVNRATAEALGTDTESAVGRTDADFNPNMDQVERFRRDDLEVMRTAREISVGEELLTDASGRARWLHTIKCPLSWDDQGVDQVLGVAMDVSERKRAEERQTLLMRELDHRVKNNLAAVLSIAEETAAGSETTDGFLAAFTGRVRSLAVAHEILSRSNWSGAELEDLVHRLTRPYARQDVDRVHVDGPPVTLPASIAPGLSMILHELLTNAAKYGALSVPAGEIAIAWVCIDRDDGFELRLRWLERSGPTVTPPTRSGFGTELVRELTRYQLRGKVDLTFDPEGVRCELRLPLEDPDASDVTSVGMVHRA